MLEAASSSNKELSSSDSLKDAAEGQRLTVLVTTCSHVRQAPPTSDFCTLVVLNYYFFLIQAMKSWLTALIKDVEEHSSQNPEFHLTAALFFIMCTGKTYGAYQQLPNSTILSLAKLITIQPEFVTKSSSGYGLLKHFLDKIRRYA